VGPIAIISGPPTSLTRHIRDSELLVELRISLACRKVLINQICSVSLERLGLEMFSKRLGFHLVLRVDRLSFVLWQR